MSFLRPLPAGLNIYQTYRSNVFPFRPIANILYSQPINVFLYCPLQA